MGARWVVRMSGCCDAGGGVQAGFPREGTDRRAGPGLRWVGLCAPCQLNFPLQFRVSL